MVLFVSVRAFGFCLSKFSFCTLPCVCGMRFVGWACAVGIYGRVRCFG